MSLLNDLYKSTDDKFHTQCFLSVLTQGDEDISDNISDKVILFLGFQCVHNSSEKEISSSDTVCGTNCQEPIHLLCSQRATALHFEFHTELDDSLNIFFLTIFNVLWDFGGVFVVVVSWFCFGQGFGGMLWSKPCIAPCPHSLGGEIS